MPTTVQVPTQLTVAHLIEAVKQLSPAELREFTQQFVTWQEQHAESENEEAMLLASIEENSCLPAVEQKRYALYTTKLRTSDMIDKYGFSVLKRYSSVES